MNRKIKTAVCLLLSALTLLFTALPAFAADGGARLRLPEGGSVFVKLRGGEPYVSLYGLALALDGNGKYESRTRTISVNAEGSSVSARSGADCITANGEKIAGKTNFISENILYIPLPSAARAFSFTLERSGNNYLFDRPAVPETPDPAAPGNEPDPDCVLWLARIIFCESRGQPFEGQLAVGTVVMNRVDSPEFPNTIYSVIFDRKYGVQFTPAGTGAVWCTPDEEALRAARTVLSGFRTDKKILYFMNEALSASLWMRQNRPYAFTIGDHSFFY